MKLDDTHIPSLRGHTMPAAGSLTKTRSIHKYGDVIHPLRKSLDRSIDTRDFPWSVPLGRGCSYAQ